MSDNARADAVARIIEPVVTAAGYDLDDVVLSQAGRRIVVRVAVDADGGIDLDAVADISREISEALDADTSGKGLGNDPYTLEVGSRGVSAPLVLERHWRRNVGRLVTVAFADRARAKVSGRIAAADADAATVTTDNGDQQVAYADIKRANIQVEFTKGGAAATADEPTDDSADDDEEI